MKRSIFYLTLTFILLIAACTKDGSSPLQNTVESEKEILTGIPCLENEHEVVEIQGMNFHKCDDLYFFGDMAFSEEVIQEMKDEHKGVFFNFNHWESNLIHLRNFPSDFHHYEEVMRTIKELEQRTNMVFAFVEEGDSYAPSEWLSILTNGDAGASFATYGRGTPSLMRISERSNIGTIRHEFGHTLGLMHEHQHPNRNAHLEYREEFVIPEFRHNFDLATNFWEVPHGDFDWNSVMLYPCWGFSIGGGLNPLTTLDDGDCYPTSEEYSDQDIETINVNYPDQRIYSEVAAHPMLTSYDWSKHEATIALPDDDKVIIGVGLALDNFGGVEHLEVTYGTISSGEVKGSFSHSAGSNISAPIETEIEVPHGTVANSFGISISNNVITNLTLGYSTITQLGNDFELQESGTTSVGTTTNQQMQISSRSQEDGLRGIGLTTFRDGPMFMKGYFFESSH